MKKRKMKMSLGTTMKLRSSSKKNVILSSPPNAIFNLNDDCLAEIFRYLPLKDVIRIFQTDDRFRSAALIRFSYGGVNRIDKEFLRYIPQDVREDFYKSYGARALRMLFDAIDLSDFIDIIRHFPNLKELTLYKLYGRFPAEVPDKMELPGSLTYLEIDQCKIDDRIFHKWFVKLNATLTELQIVEEKMHQTLYNHFEHLTNITRLEIWGDQPEEPLGRLIEQNKNNLRSLVLDREGIDAFSQQIHIPVADSVWITILSLQHLTELDLQYYKVNHLEPGPSDLWPELTSLRLNINDPSAIITRLGCQRSLTELSLNNNCFDFIVDLRILKRFPNLRTLELVCFNFDERESNWSNVRELQQIHSLIIESGCWRNYRTVIDIVANMRNLRNLKVVYGFIANVDEEKDIVEWEKKTRKGLNLFKQRNPPLQFEVSMSRD